ncbi:pyridoxal-phosphate dependent enzyme [Sandaracinobacteroides saxicola]|uniref:Pyridoxal-phosphate dependent enzyme n=1 Tax=Sandaracinobacteroides saxicola TaxID=2759707 RepID=A0A7G5IDX0_9SPHN|nr:pyridoxal-phosphate dependent enzyme [Sandaracinobacteroides saxicola]QMW21562.1 pyridoxal-phosphate dependent enzyme [Sandaracinobacteroides saxicola]
MIAPSHADIVATRARIAPALVHTPLLPTLDMPGVWLKPEMLQPHRSFKWRAALGAIADTPGDSPLVTASAGNFGQGLAAAARSAGRACTIAVPDNAAATKIEAMRRLGATLHLMPFADWWRVFSERRIEGVDGCFVHPVAQAGVIAGNASIGLEIAEALPDVASVVVPFGGGGLAVGVALGLAAAGVRAELIVVESDVSNQVAAALAADAPVPAERLPSFIDGMGGRGILPEMWPAVRAAVARVVTVSVRDVEVAVARLLGDHALIAEGAGAAAYAAVLANPQLPRPCVAVLSGGNIDPAVLCRIVRADIVRDA